MKQCVNIRPQDLKPAVKPCIVLFEGEFHGCWQELLTKDALQYIEELEIYCLSVRLS
jgi:hypothetical protein